MLFDMCIISYFQEKGKPLEGPDSVFMPSEMTKAQKRTGLRHFSESEGNCDV